MIGIKILQITREYLDYHQLTVNITDQLFNENVNEYKKWGNHYIGLLEPVMDSSHKVRVFTDDNKFISQDCRHLTQAGAKHNAENLDI